MSAQTKVKSSDDAVFKTFAGFRLTVVMDLGLCSAIIDRGIKTLLSSVREGFKLISEL